MSHQPSAISNQQSDSVASGPLDAQQGSVKADRLPDGSTSSTSGEATPGTGAWMPDLARSKGAPRPGALDGSEERGVKAARPAEGPVRHDGTEISHPQTPDTQHSAPSPRKAHGRPPRQAFVVLALLVAAGVWWLYSELTTVPLNGIAASGTIEAEEVTVASEVLGRVVELPVDEGDRVQIRRLVAKLDDSTLQLQFRMASSEAERKLLEAQIEKTSIRAPIDGVVSRRSIRLGEIASPGASLMVITSADPVELTVYVPERQVGLVNVGQRVEVRVDSFPGAIFPGEVTFISTKAEFTPRNVQTQNDRLNLVFAVKVRIPNADGRLKPGMPADATLKTE